MFEKIVVKPVSAYSGISKGSLAEALLFYQNVQILLDEYSVSRLVQNLGADTFIDLFNRPNVKATYTHGSIVTQSQEIGSLKAHSFAFVMSPEPGARDMKAKLTYRNLATMMGRRSIQAGDIKRVIKALEDKVPIKRIGADFDGQALNKATSLDLENAVALREAAVLVLRASLPAHLVPETFSIKAVSTDLGIYILTDLDFELLERQRKYIDPDGVELTEGHLLTRIWTARVELVQASKYGGDFSTSPLSSSLIRQRFADFSASKDAHDRQITNFQDVVLENCPRLSDAIEQGDRSFHEYMELLDKSDRFRQWANGIHPDREMVAAYLEELSKQGLLQRWPAKTLRFVIGATVGILAEDAVKGAGVPVGVAWGAADAYSVDRLFRQWRPSHFIDDTVKPFVRGE